jgi:hypothetical protein
MPTVTGYTAEKMKQIEDETVVNGVVNGDHLNLITREGTLIDAGNVRGPQGIPGPVGEVSQAELDAVTGKSLDVGNDLTLGADGKLYFDHDKAYFGNVPVFANAAARDAAMPNPAIGQAVYLVNTSEHLVWYGSPAKWKPPWNQPWGLQAVTKSTTSINVSGSSGVVIIQLGFAAVIGRAYDVSFNVPYICGLTPAICAMHVVVDGSASIGGHQGDLNGGKWDTGSATVNMQNLAEGGRVISVVGSTNPVGAVYVTNNGFFGGSSLLVTDVGPAVVLGRFE